MIGCHYCDQFAPTWEKLVKKYGKHLHMKKVERSEDPEMIQRYGVDSFPTIILEKKNKIKFEGERSEENFKKFLKENRVL
jgi:thiol-disulfide isomerase/thioredoxin